MMTAATQRLLACGTLLFCACAPEETSVVAAKAQEAETAPSTALEEPQVAEEPPLVLRVTQPDTADWPAIEQRGLLRVLVPRDRTNFFFAENQLRGMEYELVHELERSLARERGGSRPQIDIAFVPVAFDRLIPALVEGLGDVAAGGLTITPEREQQVAFTEAYLSGVAEIIVAHRDAPPLGALEELSGRLVVVGPGSSYLQSLEHLNVQLVERGLAPARIETPGRGFATEDMLELVNNGAFPYTVADEHLAELWSSVLLHLRLHRELPLVSGNRIAWAVRLDNPELKRVLDAFVLANGKGTRTGNILFQRYFQHVKWIEAPDVDLHSGTLGAILEPLQRYA